MQIFDWKFTEVTFGCFVSVSCDFNFVTLSCYGYLEWPVFGKRHHNRIRFLPTYFDEISFWKHMTYFYIISAKKFLILGVTHTALFLHKVGQKKKFHQFLLELGLLDWNESYYNVNWIVKHISLEICKVNQSECGLMSRISRGHWMKEERGNSIGPSN